MPRLGIGHLVTTDCGGNGEGNAIIQLMKIRVQMKKQYIQEVNLCFILSKIFL